MYNGRVIICDDEVEILRYLSKILTAKGLDLDGTEILQRIKRLKIELPVVIMTAYASINSAIEAMKLGAYDYVTKPFPKEKIFGILEKVLERKELLNENTALKN